MRGFEFEISLNDTELLTTRSNPLGELPDLYLCSFRFVCIFGPYTSRTKPIH